TILKFVDGVPMPGVGVMGIAEYARAERDGNLEQAVSGYEETPPDIIRLLERMSAETEKIADRIDAAGRIKRQPRRMHAARSEDLCRVGALFRLQIFGRAGAQPVSAEGRGTASAEGRPAAGRRRPPLGDARTLLESSQHFLFHAEGQ